VWSRSSFNRLLYLLGWLLLVVGVFCSVWLGHALFRPEGAGLPTSRRTVLLVLVACVFSGIVLMRWRASVFTLAARFFRRLPRRKQGMAAAMAVLLSVFLLESILRWTGSYDSYSERIGGRYGSPYDPITRTPWVLDSGVGRIYRDDRPEFSFEVRTNREGVRDIEHPIDKPEGEYRIVALGDSFTMGIGAEFEDSWPRVLQRRLQENGGAERIRVLCGGVSASDPVFAYQLLRRRLLKYGPDLVILMVNESDITDIMVRGGMDRFDTGGMMRKTRSPAIEWYFARSHLVRAVMMTFGGYDFLLLRPPERLERQKATLPVFVEVAEALKTLGDQYGFDCLFAAQPCTWTAVERNRAYSSNTVRTEMSAKGIPYADLTEPFLAAIDRTGSAPYSWPIDGHYNAKGYEILAEAVECSLRDLFRSSLYPWNRFLEVPTPEPKAGDRGTVEG